MLYEVITVLHEGELAQVGDDVVEAIEVGDDLRKVLQQPDVAAVADLLVANLAGFEQQLLEGVVTVLGRQAFGLEELDDVFGVEVRLDLILVSYNFV